MPERHKILDFLRTNDDVGSASSADGRVGGDYVSTSEIVHHVKSELKLSKPSWATAPRCDSFQVHLKVALAGIVICKTYATNGNDYKVKAKY